jgi:hypothetical protein
MLGSYTGWEWVSYKSNGLMGVSCSLISPRCLGRNAPKLGGGWPEFLAP